MPKSIKQAILEGRGVAGFEKGSKKLIAKPTTSLPLWFNKTPLMQYLELHHSLPIDKLVYLADSVRDTASRLSTNGAEVNFATISRWRAKIGMVINN